MEKPRKHIWVHEDFANILKANASLEGKSLLEYTEQMGKERKQKEKPRDETFKFGL